MVTIEKLRKPIPMFIGVSTQLTISLIRHTSPGDQIRNILLGISLEKMSPVFEDGGSKSDIGSAWDPVRESHLISASIDLDEAKLFKVVGTSSLGL
jgi:hypothetical protein